MPSEKSLANLRPFKNEKGKKRVTIRERKFLYLLSTTGNMQEAFRSVYKVKAQENKQLERAAISNGIARIMKRLRQKAPELVEAVTFEKIDPDFVNKAILDLFARAKTKEDMNIEARTIEMMAKTQNMFKETNVIETKITETIKNVFKETDDDMPTHKDNRVSATEIPKA